ncbi:MAG TPA: DUF523 and DUF1722 domain-containing protein [Syntrophorhabdales bacterium]|nr:DUF523 and DUF1722 domain-containing protein [Syntrophorhabdales bacterium]
MGNVTSVKKIKIGVSSCLLGQKVRYDGGHKLDRYITETLGQFFEYIPVCPEVEYGLPIPRETLRLVGDPASPRLVMTRTGVDHTEGMLRWAEGKLNELLREDLSGFIFKSRSPSSGLKGVKVYTKEGMPSRSGTGIFAGAFIRRNPLIPVIDDGRLQNPAFRENFIDSVFIYMRWQDFLKKGGRIRDMVNLHTNLKLLILAHSPKHYTMLGRLVADTKAHAPDELHASYAGLLMAATRLQATGKKHTNVLLHCLGYFKKHLTADEKAEMLEIIEAYQQSYVPLIVPITIMNHYVRKYDEPYLKRQHYLNPYPIELALRNHI